MPTHLELVRVVDVMARFKGAKTFVEESSRHFPSFYQDVGQHLSKWVAKAPKVKEQRSSESVVPTVLSNAVDMNVGMPSLPSGSLSNEDSISQRFGVFGKFLS